MLIKLAYGEEHVPIDVPDNWINGRCYRPHSLTQCADVRAELMAALSQLSVDYSLSHVGDGKNSCVIAVDPESPSLIREVLPALIEMIEDETSLHASGITVLLSNRILNPWTKADIPRLVGEEILNHYKVELHDPFDQEQVIYLGESSRRIPITVNRLYKDAELRIILGGVRPDMFTGFTGGRSVVMPGLSGKQTLRRMYDYAHIADKNTRFASFRDNPFHITGVEAVNLAGCDLAVNVTLTPTGDVFRVFAGHFGQSHMLAMASLREAMAVKVKEPMDIVVTSGGGAPWDNSLVQIVSTLSAVQSVLKPDGTIVIAARLLNGFGPPELSRLFENNNTVHEALERLSRPTSFIPGQWIAQRFYSILQSHEVIIYNKDVDEDKLWAAGLTPSNDMTQAIHEAMQSHGQRCKIVALPDGPMGIGEIVKV